MGFVLKHADDVPGPGFMREYESCLNSFMQSNGECLEGKPALHRPLRHLGYIISELSSMPASPRINEIATDLEEVYQYLSLLSRPELKVINKKS